MKLYTKTGDDGYTGLIGGERAAKHSARVQAYGEVDELNALLGWSAVVCTNAELRASLETIQHELFAIGAELACTANTQPPGIVPLDEPAVTRLESWIDLSCAAVPPLKQFILPGGSESGARLHVARAVCRRAERAVTALSEAEEVRRVLLHYLNRLSDLLFAWARQLSHDEGIAEVPWNPDSA